MKAITYLVSAGVMTLGALSLAFSNLLSRAYPIHSALAWDIFGAAIVAGGAVIAWKENN